MPQNIEIKARLTDLQRQLNLARKLCGEEGRNLHQVDVFFRSDFGRLKLRRFEDGSGELIFYRRDDSTGPKLSEYVISPTNTPDALQEALTKAHGVTAVVEKERTVLIHGRTRIHLDQVSDLGDFLELEVVLPESESIASGQQEAAALMRDLDIDESMLIDCAYVDLLLRQKPTD
ncbi:MAG: class IV adenylate cyclase [Rubripirellula sp.]